MPPTPQGALILLAFEGPDRVGKSSLIRAVNHLSNYKYLCIDRFLGSAWVYDRLTARRERAAGLEHLLEELVSLSAGHLITVYVSCDEGELRQRILDENPTALMEPESYQLVLALYEEFLSLCPLMPCIRVNTTGRDAADVARDVFETVEEILP